MIGELKSFLFENKSIRQTVTKNIFWLTLGQVLCHLIRAVVIIYAARLLGANEYGVFSYLLGLAAFFTVFADIGINKILTREASRDEERSSHYFAASFWMKIVLFFAVALIIIFVAPHFIKIEAAKTLIPFIAILVIFDGIRDFSSAFFHSRQKMELETLLAFVTNFMITVLGFLALYFCANVRSLLFAYITAAGIGALAAIILLKKEFKKVISYFDKKMVKPIFDAAWPIALLTVLGAFMLSTDIIMLGWLRTASEVGFYSAGQRIVQLLYALPAILASATFPIFSKLISQKEDIKLKLLLEKSIILAFAVAFPITLGGIILSKPIINLIYGAEYLPGIFCFVILLLTLLIMFPGLLIGNSILAYNQQRKMSFYLALGAFGNILFDALLIPFYGIAGAAVATVLTQLIYVSLSWKLLKKINDFFTFRYLKKIIIAAALMGIFTAVFSCLGLNVIIDILISGGIYFLILTFLKEEVLWEIKPLWQAFKR